MKTLKPVHLSTRVHPRTHEWIPDSVEGLFTELDSLQRRGIEDQRLLLYRGQQRREWLLDSTFVRSIKTRLFNMPVHETFSERLQDSGDLNSALTSLLLFKFGTLLGPSDELKAVEAEHGVDAWFELMKRYQQYPEADMPAFAGTNFLDWSHSRDVALYFANDGRTGESALFVCDATATGKTQQVLPVVEILNKVREQFTRGDANGVPLLFSPSKQIANHRAKNQQAVYFAQMELRLNMLEAWRMQESSLQGETVILKIVLPAGSEQGVSDYLSEKGITKEFIFPDKLAK